MASRKRKASDSSDAPLPSIETIRKEFGPCNNYNKEEDHWYDYPDSRRYEEEPDPYGRWYDKIYPDGLQCEPLDPQLLNATTRDETEEYLPYHRYGDRYRRHRAPTPEPYDPATYDPDRTLSRILVERRCGPGEYETWARNRYGEDWYALREAMLLQKDEFQEFDWLYYRRQNALRVIEHRADGRPFRPSLGTANPAWKRLWARLSESLSGERWREIRRFTQIFAAEYALDKLRAEMEDEESARRRQPVWDALSNLKEVNPLEYKRGMARYNRQKKCLTWKQICALEREDDGTMTDKDANERNLLWDEMGVSLNWRLEMSRKAGFPNSVFTGLPTQDEMDKTRKFWDSHNLSREWQDELAPMFFKSQVSAPASADSDGGRGRAMKALHKTRGGRIESASGPLKSVLAVRTRPDSKKAQTKADKQAHAEDKTAMQSVLSIRTRPDRKKIRIETDARGHADESTAVPSVLSTGTRPQAQEHRAEADDTDQLHAIGHAMATTSQRLGMAFILAAECGMGGEEALVRVGEQLAEFGMLLQQDKTLLEHIESSANARHAETKRRSLAMRDACEAVAELLPSHGPASLGLDAIIRRSVLRLTRELDEHREQVEAVKKG